MTSLHHQANIAYFHAAIGSVDHVKGTIVLLMDSILTVHQLWQAPLPTSEFLKGVSIQCTDHYSCATTSPAGFFKQTLSLFDKLQHSSGFFPQRRMPVLSKLRKCLLSHLCQFFSVRP